MFDYNGPYGRRVTDHSRIVAHYPLARPWPLSLLPWWPARCACGRRSWASCPDRRHPDQEQR